MKLLFTRSNTIGSLAIRIKTRSRFSHTAILLSDGTVIDSTFKHGVARRTYEEFAKSHSLIVETEVDGDENIAKQYIGAKYDYSAIFGFVALREWNDPTKWFCSELTAICCDVFRKDYINEITPEIQFSVTTGYKILKGRK